MINPKGTKSRVLISWYFKKGNPLIYEPNNPISVLGYIPQESRAQTPRLVQRKKKMFDDIPASVPEKILFNFKFLNTPINKIGSKNPLHVNIKIIELPITKSEKTIKITVRIKASFLSK